MRPFAIALIIFISSTMFSIAETKPTAQVTEKDVRSAMQNKQFSEAVKFLDSLLTTEKTNREYYLYLKGLSLFYDKKYSEAIKVCDEITAKQAESAWNKKAVFLKADCLLQQKNFVEAEKIYNQEAQRLLLSARKEDIANIYFRFAEEVSRIPKKDELDVPPPNFQKAYGLYKRILGLEIGESMKDEVTFRLGRMMQLSGSFPQAVDEYHRYLKDFDPDWTGPADSPELYRADKQNVPKGKHRFEARYYLAESRLAMDIFLMARINLEDLLNLIPKSDTNNEKLIRDSRYLLVKTYHIPQPRDINELESGVKVAKQFITDFPNDARALRLAYEIAQAYDGYSRTEEALNAYQDFLKLTYDPTMKEIDSLTAENFEQLKMSTTYRLGELLLARKDYPGAIEIWSQYIAQFQNGPQWAEAQRGIINAEFQKGVDLITQEKYDEAVATWNKFIEKYPLDERSRQIMFAYGQLHYHSAEQAEAKKQQTEAETEYKKAIAEWEKLVGKYPNMEESSLALFRIGQIYEEKLMDFEKALESYRKLTWGSWYGEAQNRIRNMVEKKLQLVTERIFRTNEPAKVKLTLRNIEKLTVDIYKVDLEAYWRKTHGIIGVEDLDIALISPDKTQEYPVPEYKKYKQFEQYIEIPMEGAGVYAVHVSEDDLEATTLIIRSDVDVIVKTSRQEVLVFAEDMIKQSPVAKAKVLISNGEKVIGEGETGEDGIFLKKLDELKETDKVTAFIVQGKNVASNSLDISSLSLSVGLTARGYIYTDKSAYRPGQKVSIKGIIRDVKDGVYVVTPDVEYEVSVIDSQGRILYSEMMKLSKFGTFNAEMQLDDNAFPGSYQILAKAKDDESRVWAGGFQVQLFQLEKIKLAIEFPQKVYFRGEKVEATFVATYYYGQPVVNRMIRYTLPDGRNFTEPLDAEGKFKVTFDTTSSQPGTILAFGGTIEGEGIPWVSENVFLAFLEFSIKLIKPSTEVAISGEPFDVSIETNGADGKPIGKELTLTVYQIVERPSHPILSQIPWMGVPNPITEIKVSDYKVTTDAKTGKGIIEKIKLDKGGSYVLRATGNDRFNQPVLAQTGIIVSDDKDTIKLRILADRSQLKVGEKAKVKIHSRLETSSLALLTYEGEGIISHKIQKLIKGWNEVELNVTNEYFPNFKVAVSAMNIESANIAPKLVMAEKDFTVERQLSITIKVNESYLPGEETEAEVTVTDQVGKPAEAELSLALVEEALFALYPDAQTPITDFFSEGTHREAGMMTLSSCTFRYEPATRKVLKELLEEVERLTTEAEGADRKREVAIELSDKLSLSYDAAAKPATAGAAGGTGLAQMRRTSKAAEKNGEVGFAYGNGVEEAKKMAAPMAGGRMLSAAMAPEPRKEFPEAGGYWLPVIVTDATGKAKAKIIMPDKITQWRITSRGCTVDTIVGQTTLNTITKKSFFVEVKLPSIVTEGDVLRTPIRVHNLSSYEGNISLTLKLTVDERTVTDQKQVAIKKNDTVEVVFNGMTILAGREAQFEISAKAGDMTDAVTRTLPIRPWGVEYADNKGGVSSGNESIFLQLPEDQKYTSKQLTINIGPSVNRLVFDLAMGYMPFRDISFASKIIPIPGDMGSDLLAVAYAIDYLKKIGGNVLDSKQLMDRARSLVSSIVSSQSADGGWTWFGITKSVESDIFTTSRTFWALAEAKKQGITINPQTIEKATAYLKSAFTRVDQNDDDTKSVILHALSTVNEADFAYANRLYRNRNEMKPPTLAYTALTFVNLSRNEIGSEILAVFVTKKLDTLDVETSALGLLAMESITPDSPTVKQYVDYIISKHSYCGFAPYRAKGPAVAAIATYYGKTQFAKSDYRLAISVNGTKVKELDVRKEQPSTFIPVQTKLIIDGKNKVDFAMEGKGGYSYTITLSGFSPDIKDPKSWDKPNVESRRYYHAPLEYKGRQMSYSTTEITQLPDGERTNVSVGISEAYSSKYIIVTEYLPVGTNLVDNSVAGNYQHYVIGDGMITFYYLPGRDVKDFSYQLVSYVPGTYRALPTIIRDAMNTGQMRIGEIDSLEVLAPGEKSKDEYKMNDSELYEFGKAYFDDGDYANSLSTLSKLYDRSRTYNQREVARMLLWIHTEEKYYNAKKVVEYFEILKERFPELYIPFDRIMTVGKAYREIGEFERAYLVYKATIDASFINDSNVSAVLQDEGQFLNSIDFQENTWREYPNTPQVVSSYFAISQALYSKVPQADQLAKAERKLKILGSSTAYKGKDRKITKPDLLKETILMLSEFLTLYPNDPLTDDAVFSMANALLDLEDYNSVVLLCGSAQKRYPESDFMTSFQYIEALGYFWQHKYDEAINSAKLVADGKSQDKNLSEYIVGQIYHAQGKPDMAMDWYKKVEDIYPDAKESISYFQQKQISMDEVKIFRPKENVKIKIKYRNIKEVFFQVYRVDLMKLYLREKDLNKVSQVHLAGIAPEQSGTVTFGDGKDYIDKEKEIDLTALKDDKTYKDGAYLVICRGDDLFTSELVLVTPIDLDIQEDAVSGRVRVNVRDVVKGGYKESVHVKAIGSAQSGFMSGKTDLRGLYIADGINGIATVIAREGKDTYAFYRGKNWLGAQAGRGGGQQVEQQIQLKYSEGKDKADYRYNIEVMNQAIQSNNLGEFDQMRRGVQKGVQVQNAH
jgi:uncharacterized protein YfaS (alpha-2-macroglobulin family)/TolA-binding protein